MGIRIDALDTTVNPSRDHEVPAMKDGLTVKLTVGQVLDILVAGAPSNLNTLDEIAAAIDDDPAFATKVLMRSANLSDLSDKEASLGELLENGGTSLEHLKWLCRGIGELYAVDTSMTGTDVPPTDSSLYRYILLTAGEDGTGEYNEGVLTGESVSGSAPLVVATATIDFAASPLDGETVHLINTEGRFLRAGLSPGDVQDDAVQGHRHNLHIVSTALANGSNFARLASTGGVNTADFVRDLVADGDNGTPRTAAETRAKNLALTYYMRIA